MAQASAQQDRSLLVAVYRDKVMAMDRGSGQIRWRAELPSQAKADLVVHGGRVFVVQDQTVHCFDYGAGQKLGTVELPFRASTDRPRMMADAGQLVVMDSGAFACFSMDGQLLWQQTEARAPGALGAFGFPDNVLAPDWTR